jgi:hypothetical protein
MIKISLKDYNLKYIACWEEETTKELFTDEIKNADIIITQPIRDNYRDVDYLSTSYILANRKETTKIIMFPSLYFPFYYFDTGYNGLSKPDDYQYFELIKFYKNNKSLEKFIDDVVNNTEYKTKKELEIIAENNINHLQDREEFIKLYDNVSLICISEYISNNYKDLLLFYSINHPSKYLLFFVAKRILDEFNIGYSDIIRIDPFGNKCIIYKCIQQITNFDITKHLPYLHGQTDIKTICQMYYDEYDKEENKSFII